MTNLNEALETVRAAMLRDADTGTPKEFHDRMEALSQIEARLGEAEAILRVVLNEEEIAPLARSYFTTTEEEGS
jgi:hypothetical protein